MSMSRQQLSVLNFALDQISEAIYLIDEEARIVEVNAESCRALEYGRDELLGLRVFDVDANFLPADWPTHWQQLIRERTLRLESRHRSRSGRIFAVEIQANYFEHEGKSYNFALVRDISERKLIEEELQRREQEFRALVENSPDAIVRYDRNCRRLYANPTFSRLSGRSIAELLGKKPCDLAQTDSTGKFEEILTSVFADGREREYEHVWTASDGGEITSHIRLAAELDQHGQVVSVLAVGRDITAVKESQRRLQHAEAMARIGHWQFDFRSKKTELSAEVCRLFGREAGWQPSIDEFMEPIVDEDRERVRALFREAIAHRMPELGCSFRIKRGSGVLHFHSQTHLEYETDGKCQRLIGTAQDITELKDYEFRLHEIAFYDILTNLPNRSLLRDRLRQALAEASRRSHALGLLIVDLDGFKKINDTHGLSLGDRLICEVAKRLKSLMRDYDTVARLGGDEFAIVLPEIREAADLGGIARKILDALARPFRLLEQDLFVSASIGIAVFPSDGENGDTLLQYADSALHDAKARGRAGFRFYSRELTVKSKDRTALETALRHAEPAKQLELYYQPKIDLVDGRLVGAEALIRWQHPQLGMVPPDKFIGIAEDTGLIVGMGAWVLTKACLAAQSWNKRGHNLKVAVNLSSRQFRDDELQTTVRSILSMTGCEPRWLELEITESLLLDDDDAVRTSLQAFRDMGISIAIDDFGTGYSALGYLKRFPIDVLKIDRSFTRDVTVEHDSTELVKAIITMARSLGLALVAEGIETEAQERFLQAHGCHLGQGYRYGKPMPRESFEVAILSARPSTPDAPPPLSPTISLPKTLS